MVHGEVVGGGGAGAISSRPDCSAGSPLQSSVVVDVDSTTSVEVRRASIDGRSRLSVLVWGYRAVLVQAAPIIFPS